MVKIHFFECKSVIAQHSLALVKPSLSYVQLVFTLCKENDKKKFRPCEQCFAQIYFIGWRDRKRERERERERERRGKSRGEEEQLSLKFSQFLQSSQSSEDQAVGQAQIIVLQIPEKKKWKKIAKEKVYEVIGWLSVWNEAHQCGLSVVVQTATT